jgi:uncharacterized protein YuzE
MRKEGCAFIKSMNKIYCVCCKERQHNGYNGISFKEREGAMKIYYDKEVDAAYIKLSDITPAGVIEIAEGINVDTTDSGEVVGIELLDASKKFPLK